MVAYSDPEKPTDREIRLAMIDLHTGQDKETVKPSTVSGSRTQFNGDLVIRPESIIVGMRTAIYAFSLQAPMTRAEGGS